MLFEIKINVIFEQHFNTQNMKSSIRLVFNRYKRLKNGKAAIYVEVAFNRRLMRYVNTKIYVEPIFWNDKKKEITAKMKGYVNANLYIRNFVNKIQEYEMELINKNKSLTPELLEKFIAGKKENSTLFYKFALDQLYKEKLSIGSFNMKRAILKKLERHTPNLTFADLDYNYIKNIDDWLKNQESITSINTIANYHKEIKKYIRLAINLGYIGYENNPYNQFKIKRTATTRTNLTESELKKFETVKIDNYFVTKIQDMFLFSCYTGLRYSDIVNLQQKHIEINDDEVIISIKKMIKTQKPVELPLKMLFNGKPLKIFEKYYKKNKKFLFGEPLTNQYINRELKFIARTAEIFNKELTFHMARHTFGSLLAEKVGDPYLIKDLMGHSDIKMSMEYIHSSRKGRNDKLMNVDW